MLQVEIGTPARRWGSVASIEIADTIIPESVTLEIERWAAQYNTREGHIARMAINEFVSHGNSGNDPAVEFDQNPHLNLGAMAKWSHIIHGGYLPHIPRFVIGEDGQYSLVQLDDDAEDTPFDIPSLEDPVTVTVSADGKFFQEGSRIKDRLERVSFLTAISEREIAAAALVRAASLRNIRKRSYIGIVEQDRKVDGQWIEGGVSLVDVLAAVYLFLPSDGVPAWSD